MILLQITLSWYWLLNFDHSSAPFKVSVLVSAKTVQYTFVVIGIFVSVYFHVFEYLLH